MVHITHLRKPAEEEIEKTPKWSGTTERILKAIKSEGTVTSAELQLKTGYTPNTLHAQQSVLHRMRLLKKQGARLL